MTDRNHKGVSFQWADVNRLASGLQDGELCLATALGQFGAIVRDGLKIIENYAAEQMKLNLDRKLKLDKMDKLVKDLTEKCQCMQQALMYKEEKYDEKCREVERYKVICELSAKSAVNDELYYASMDENNNAVNQNTIDTHVQEPLLERDDAMSLASHSTGRRIKVHTKISTDQIRSRSSMPVPAPNRQVESASASGDKLYQVKRDEVSNMAAYYAGGPTRRPRKQIQVDVSDETNDIQLRDKLNTIGSINVNQTSRPDPAVDRPFRTDHFDADDRQRSTKIALVGQRNEVMSSSRNAVRMMRQKLSDKNLHRQVAEGSYNRLASRRKKEWPF